MLVCGLDVENTYTYQGSNVQTQSSCALNLVNCTGVVIDGATIKSRGKSTFILQANSTATMNDSTVEGYYFVINAGASDVTVNNSTLTSDAPFGDNHSLLWTNVTYSITEGGPAARPNMKMTLNSCQLDLNNGKPVVSGSTSDLQQSADIHLNNATITFPDEIEDSNFGLVGYSPNWGSMTLTYSGGTVFTRNGYQSISSQLVPFVTSTVAQPHSNVPNKGLGKFVNYQNLNQDGEISEPYGGPASRGGLLPASNLVSDGLDATAFNPNDENDPIFQ